MAETLVIQAEMAELARVAAWAEALAASLNLPSSTSFAIQLCFEEAVSNVVRHGFEGQPEKPGVNKDVRLVLQHAGDVVTATIEDFGVAFNPLTVVPPAVPVSIAEATIGGQGIRLMRQFAQHMAYERCDGMNRLTLRFDVSKTGD